MNRDDPRASMVPTYPAPEVARSARHDISTYPARIRTLSLKLVYQNCRPTTRDDAPFESATSALALIIPVSAFTALSAQTPADPAATFDKREVMVPMRDGVKLHTLIYTPKNQTGNLPIIFTRTPYGIAGAAGAFATSYAEMAKEGYIFAFQDIRGRFTSEGQFVMLRPPRDKKDPKAIDEASDTYDTIDWMLKNVPKQQRTRRHARRLVPGLAHRHGDARPASRAQGRVAAGLAVVDVPRRRLPPQRRVPPDYGFEYVAMMEEREGDHAVQVRPVRHLQLVPVVRLAQEGHRQSAQGKLPTWKNYVAHPELRRVLAARERREVPRPRERADAQRRRLVGPGRLLWPDHDLPRARAARHEAPELPRRRAVEPRRLARPHGRQARRDRVRQQHGAILSERTSSCPWFNYWLKDKGKLELAEATTFETGANDVALVRQLAAQA